MDIDLFDRSKILIKLYMCYIIFLKEEEKFFKVLWKKISFGFLIVFMKNCFCVL